MAEQVIDDPVLAQRYVFRRVTDDAGAEVLEVDCRVDPGGGVHVPHIHPVMQETFKVLVGEFEFRVGRRKLRAMAGESAVVPPGTAHTYENVSSEEGRVVCHASPADAALEQFLTDAAGLARAGKFTRSGIPIGFSGLLLGALLIDSYREMVIFLRPPRALQKLFVGPLARLARRRGYSAGELARLA